ncbi:MAG: hypothetical protein ACRCW0_08115 [Clostridium sp.]
MMDYTYDKTDKNYIRFKKYKLNLTINDLNIQFPCYINRAVSRYRFNTQTLILEKFCNKCKIWFKIFKYENTTFIKIIDENVFHFLGDASGFSSYCQECSNKDKNPDIDNETNTNTKDSDTNCISGEKSHLNMIIDENLKYYLKLEALSKKKTLTDLVIKILSDYQNKNPNNFPIYQKQETN